MQKEKTYTIQNHELLDQWNAQSMNDLEDLYGAALRKSLRLLCRECAWGLLALSIFYGLGSLFLW